MNILEQLEQNKSPSTQKEFKIMIKGTIGEGTSVIIKDKSKTSHINRSMILDRLKAKSKIERQLVSQAPTPSESIQAQEDFQQFTNTVLEKEEIMEEREKTEKLDEKETHEKEEEEEEEPEKEIQKQPLIKTTKKTTRKMKDIIVSEEEPRIENFQKVQIGKTIVGDRLPKRERIIMKVSPYYMTNRKQFSQRLSTIFTPYREKLASNAGDISCEDTRNDSRDLELLTHQEVVRDYLNLYTPYRGLLLYHGLGSGKTCSSIAIAEGMKTNKKIVIMTPASLKMNFFSELKKCGDHIYRKNQFWEFIPIEGQPNFVSVLSQALSISPEYIKSKGGAWLTDITKESNFTSLSTSDQNSLDEQINMMIRAKYVDINYNGLNSRKMRELQGDENHNPFDHSVVIIDEAHNLVSRIANKIDKPQSIAGKLYEWLLSAIDIRIILLTGTPIINYPHETGILFNILRGYIKTWEFQIKTKTTEKFNRDIILKKFIENDFNTYDYVEFSGDKLTITRNPFGFVNTLSRKDLKGGADSNIKSDPAKKEDIPIPKTNNLSKSKKQSPKNKTFRIIQKNPDNSILDTTTITEEEETELRNETLQMNYNELHSGGGPFEDYDGVILDQTGNISDNQFEKRIISILSSTATIGKPSITKYKCLPDNSKQFSEMFITQTGEVVQIDAFKRRILGLTSYFRSAQEQLLPTFIKSESGESFHKVLIEMSEHQFSVYYKIRNTEREQEKLAKRKRGKKQAGWEDEQIASSYRIFSRAGCNFTFPNNIPRPMPPKLGENDMVDEDVFNAVTTEIKHKADDFFEEDERPEKGKSEKETDKISDTDILSYQQQIDAAMNSLKYNEREPTETNYLLPEGLEQYSPKFLRILENIRDPENIGLHLLYSQFRTIEGIGIMKLILEANGFTQFRISKTSDTEWEIHEDTLASDKPKFMLYTGTESAEEKEILRNIYNSVWEHVPSSIVSELRKQSKNEQKNFTGDIIKLMMITSSGAEGINLRNTRFVHIVEPYWNKSRLDQVIGRARRICSHQDLPEELRTVKVFIYISTLSKEQREDKKNVELTIHDLSKRDRKTAFTTDETLYEISEIKDGINRQILKAVKETAIDCSLYNTEINPEEPLVCYGFGKVISNQFGSYPKLEEDIRQPTTEQAVRKERWNAKKIRDPASGKEYAMNPNTREVYDLDSYQRYIESGMELQLVGHIVERVENGKRILVFKKI
jgi:hypothetical protein